MYKHGINTVTRKDEYIVSDCETGFLCRIYLNSSIYNRYIDQTGIKTDIILNIWSLKWGRVGDFGIKTVTTIAV